MKRGQIVHFFNCIHLNNSSDLVSPVSSVKGNVAGTTVTASFMQEESLGPLRKLWVSSCCCLLVTGDLWRASLLQNAESVPPGKLCLCKSPHSCWVPSVLPLTRAVLLATIHHVSTSKNYCQCTVALVLLLRSPHWCHRIVFSLGWNTQGNEAFPAQRGCSFTGVISEPPALWKTKFRYSRAAA